MKLRFVQISYLLIFISIFCSQISAQERQVFPVDEGKTDASFNIFRENLIKAVKNRDKKFLLSSLDTNIKASFGGDDGIADFKKLWKIDNSNSKLWDELLIVLSGGGKFIREGKNNLFCAPYSFTNFPEDLDAFEYQIIFGENVKLRARPDSAAEVTAQLSYNVVKVDYENSVGDRREQPTYSWMKIETLGGKKGFVSAKYVRSPIDYRACFEKKKGKWKMTVFVAGD